MKLNLGCGYNKVAGFVNIDKYATANPDLQVDLEQTPWPFETNSVDEILLNHTLEHLGERTETFLALMVEMHRVCRNGAVVQINVPHPRHDNFINDPTHVRAITPELLGLFNKPQCQAWVDGGYANSPLALYLDVDFRITQVSITPEPQYVQQLESGQLDFAAFTELMRRENNVASEYRITLTVVK